MIFQTKYSVLFFFSFMLFIYFLFSETPFWPLTLAGVQTLKNVNRQNDTKIQKVKNPTPHRPLVAHLLQTAAAIVVVTRRVKKMYLKRV